MKKRILLLTGKKAEGRKEDLFLAKYLKKKFIVQVSNINKCEDMAKTSDLILIRNIWPTSNFLAQDRKILSSLIKKGMTIYNPGINEEDIIGKEYLVYLYKKGFPVIPSIDEKLDSDLISGQNFYFIKPKHGGGREGCKKILAKDIRKVDFQKYIVQPFLDFKYEVSFYFIDNKFIYALYAPDKKKRWKLKELKVNKKDRAFAQSFVNLNNLPYGIQRIDACRTRDGSLLLMEIEDWCPYLSLLDINPRLRNKFMEKLVISLSKVTSKKNTHKNKF